MSRCGIGSLRRNAGFIVIGLVIVTHGNLGQEFVRTVEYTVGPQAALEAVSIDSDAPQDQQKKAIRAAVKRVEQGDGVIILTDMFGGTPSNLAISVMDGVHTEVVAGLNLPMLVKLVSVRKEHPVSLADAAHAAQEAGRKYINVVSALLG